MCCLICFFCNISQYIHREYLPDLLKAREQREKTLKSAQEEAKADSMSRVMRDLEIDRARNPAGALADRWDPNAEDEYNGDDDDDTELDIIDRCTSSFGLCIA